MRRLHSHAASLACFLASQEDVRAVDPTLFRNRMEIMMRPGGVAMMKTILMEVSEKLWRVHSQLTH